MSAGSDERDGSIAPILQSRCGWTLGEESKCKFEK